VAVSLAVQGRLEFPAGTVEPNEDPAETIKRIEEETAYLPSGGKTRRIFPALATRMKSSTHF